MYAIVEAEISTRLSAPRLSRAGGSGALVSENGTDAASLIVSPGEVLTAGTLVTFGKRFPVGANLPNRGRWAQASADEWVAHQRLLGRRRRRLRPRCLWAGRCAVPQHDLARHRDHARLLRRVTAEDQP